MEFLFIMESEKIYERIQNAKLKANRNDKIFFTAVSKTRTVDEMKEAEKISWVDFFGMRGHRSSPYAVCGEITSCKLSIYLPRGNM